MNIEDVKNVTECPGMVIPTIFERQGYAAEFVPLMKGDLPHQSLQDLLVGELTQLAAEL